MGVSALGSKVRDYNIPGMPFRVHQFGTPVPSLRSSLFTAPRARARASASRFSPPCPSCLPALRSVPDEREAPWKRITLVTLLPRPPLPPPALILVLERTSVRPDPFQEGPAIRESVNALTYFSSSPFPLLPRAFVNCKIVSEIV